MSLEAPQLQTFIDRIVDILKKDPTLFPAENVGNSLVTNVLGNRRAIEQSADDAVIPYILVFESSQPIKFLEKAGRDGRNVEGGSVYELEFYCVAISNVELSVAVSQQSIHVITQAIRNALSRNLRLANPDDLNDNPLCRTHSRYEIPYLLRGDIPATLYARNVVVRPQVYVSPRSL